MIRNELRHAIRQAKSDNLVQAFKQKFDKLNPLYNAVVETSPSISVLSSSSSPEHRNHSSPLNGVPFLVKEVINVENFATTLCDPSLKTSFASSIFTKLKSKDEEAGLVTMLKEKGGVVVGKTNVPLKAFYK